MIKKLFTQKEIILLFIFVSIISLFLISIFFMDGVNLGIF